MEVNIECFKCAAFGFSLALFPSLIFLALLLRGEK